MNAAASSIRLLQLGADPGRAAACLRVGADGRILDRRPCTPEHPLPAEPGARDLLVVPAEALRLLWLDLPAHSTAQAAAAARLMLQDQIARPERELHVAVGEATPGTAQRLVGVVDAAQMRDWLQRATQLGLRTAAVVPDCLLLDAPADARVQISECDGRLLARGPTLALAGEADLVHHVVGAHAVQPLDAAGRDACFAANAGKPLALDLLQGAYARRDTPAPRRGRRLRWLAAAVLLSPLVMVGADAAYRTLAARALVQQTDAVAAQVHPQLTGATLGAHYRQRLAPDLLAAHSAALFDALQAVPGTRLDSYEFAPATGVRAGLVHAGAPELDLLREHLAGAGLALVPLDSQPVEAGLRTLVAVEPL